MIKEIQLEELFTIHSGDFHATAELDSGSIPLISCGDINNGLVGFFDVPKAYQYSNLITVAYNGKPLTAKYHPYIFGAKDDVAVLFPKTKISQKAMIYIAVLFNQQRWRFSYGRKCFKEKLQKMSLPLPIDGSGKIDEDEIARDIPLPKTYLPKKNKTKSASIKPYKWESMKITELFELLRGDFHSIAALDAGKYMTVSRTSEFNGVVGFYDAPKGAKVYPAGMITVSTVSGDAFVQLKEFIVTDNVVICEPKEKLQLTTLFFIQMMLNQVKWRYSYGRQCYKTKFAQTQIYLPMTKDRELDESYMANVIKNTPYWRFVSETM